MTMSARYNTRVTVQRPVTARADNGEQTVTMQAVVTRWAALISKQGAEQQTSGVEVRATQHLQVRMRHESALSTISPDWRLVVGSRVLRIVAIDNLENRNRELILTCVEDV